MFRVKTFILLIGLIVSQLSLNAEELRLGSPFFPPYVYVDMDGELSGLWMTQLYPVLNEAGISFNAVHVPIKRFYASAATGKIDLFAMPKGRAGMENVVFSERPFAHFDLRAFWLDGAENIQALSQLSGHKVALIKGYSYGGLLATNIQSDQQLEFVTAENQKVALEMLMNKEVDYVLGYWAVMTYLQKNYPNEQINNMKIAELPIYLAMHNSVNNAEQLMQSFNAALPE